VGWPANGNSSSGVKMSICHSDGEDVADSWRNTVSERLNSLAMSCFCVCVMEFLRDEGICTIASGLPVKGVLVKTSRVVNERICEGGILGFVRALSR